jgi:methionine sulfoxide reductase heme-binding subunit
MSGLRLVVVSFFAASSLGVLALGNADLGTVPWAVSRASGLAAFAVLSASVIMGLLISTKAGDELLSRPFVFEMHQFLSVAALALIAVHAGSLLFDGFLQFTSLSLVVPFLSPYRPIAVAAGVVSAWLVAITTASFWLRSRIGTKRWRKLHYVTFLAYFGSLGHGVFAGTDTQLPVVYWGYVVSVAAVTALTTLRISGYRSSARSARQAKPATARLAEPHMAP